MVAVNRTWNKKILALVGVVSDEIFTWLYTQESSKDRMAALQWIVGNKGLKDPPDGAVESEDWALFARCAARNKSVSARSIVEILGCTNFVERINLLIDIINRERRLPGKRGG